MFSVRRAPSPRSRLLRRLAATSCAAVTATLIASGSPLASRTTNSQDTGERTTQVALAPQPLSQIDLALINTHRTAQGLQALVPSGTLQTQANAWANTLRNGTAPPDALAVMPDADQAVPATEEWVNVSRRSEESGSTTEALHSMLYRWADTALDDPALTHIGAASVPTARGTLVVVHVGTLVR
jgi:hypothetical protein